MDFAITIKDDFVEVTAPEGQSGRMPLEAFFELCRPPAADTGDAPLPTGVRFVRTRGRVTIWVHETPPQVWNLKWIETSSGGPGSRTRPTYRDVIVSLPYIVVVAVFAPGDDDRINLTTRNECFFRNASLGSGEEDELLVPALLNCSLFDDPKGKTKIGFNEMPVVWICTQHLDRERFAGIGDDGRRLVAGFETLMTMLMGAGFNHSSDEHEFCSGFTANRQVDPRVANDRSLGAGDERGSVLCRDGALAFDRLHVAGGRRADLQALWRGPTRGAPRRRRRPRRLQIRGPA